jgi:hypothetical protein
MNSLLQVPAEKYCDMTPESWNSSLLDNSSLGMFLQQRIGLWKPDCFYGINTRFPSNGKTQNNRGTIWGGDLYLVHPEVIQGGYMIHHSFFIRP